MEKVTVANVGDIANPAFRGYAQRYVDIEEGFREAVADFGVPFAEPVDEGDREAAVEELASLGVRSLNDGKSLVSGWQSPACAAPGFQRYGSASRPTRERLPLRRFWPSSARPWA